MSLVLRSLRTLSGALLTDETLEHLVVPILSDIDVERLAAREGGRPWRARWIVLRGCIGLMEALALHSCRIRADARGLFAAVFAILTIALTLSSLHGIGFGFFSISFRRLFH